MAISQGDVFSFKGAQNTFLCIHQENYTRTAVSIFRDYVKDDVIKYSGISNTAILGFAGTHDLMNTSNVIAKCDILYGKVAAGPYIGYGIIQGFLTTTGDYFAGYFF